MHAVADEGSLLLAVLSAQSAETLSSLMVAWHRALKADAELMSIIGFFMETGEWERARESLARAYGRTGGPHRAKFNVLLAASQSMRALNSRRRRLSPLH